MQVLEPRLTGTPDAVKRWVRPPVKRRAPPRRVWPALVSAVAILAATLAVAFFVAWHDRGIELETAHRDLAAAQAQIARLEDRLAVATDLIGGSAARRVVLAGGVMIDGGAWMVFVGNPD